MPKRHHAFWPRLLSHHLGAPETNLFFNVEVSAARYPHKPYLIYFDTAVTFLEFKRDAERLAGYLRAGAAASQAATGCCSACRTARSSRWRSTPSCGPTRWWCRSTR